MNTTALFLSYTPRADSAARGYEPWLRAVDNAFFNAQPAISHYTNWKFAEAVGPGAEFTHFDFMLLVDGASPGDLFGRPDVQQFVQTWTRDWGREPDGPPDRNCSCTLIGMSGEPELLPADVLALSFDAPGFPGEVWGVEGDLIGRVPFKTLTRRFLAPGEALDPGWRAELIAAP